MRLLPRATPDDGDSVWRHGSLDQAPVQPAALQQNPDEIPRRDRRELTTQLGRAQHSQSQENAREATIVVRHHRTRTCVALASWIR
ncbi:hypothetical protein BCAR13_100195 [Paraburkholderia caribensis]|nr:hypothetical protein BCAR13_100195 [Paraburkholderia caribensis]